jgi:hypothetical protein
MDKHRRHLHNEVILHVGANREHNDYSLQACLGTAQSLDTVLQGQANRVFICGVLNDDVSTSEYTD